MPTVDSQLDNLPGQTGPSGGSSGIKQDGKTDSETKVTPPSSAGGKSEVDNKLGNIVSRTHNDDSLESTLGRHNNQVQLDGTNDNTDDMFFQPDAQESLSIPGQAKFLSSLTFKPDIDLKTNPITRCNTVDPNLLSKCLAKGLTAFQSATKLKIDATRLPGLFNTALAWHIAEYRPTAVTHGKILDVDAQAIFDKMINKERGITIRRIARAWSPAISAVLHSYASLNPPVFTTQCNDTFADPHTRLAVAPYFFDGVDPGTIPVNLSRLVATGLAYSKRQATNSPYSLHKRPAFVTQKEEDLNMALHFTG